MVAGLDTHYIRYVYSDTNSCSDSVQNYIVVHAQPIIYAGLFPPYCAGNSFEKLPSGLPAGGNYSGPGVIDSLFHSAISGLGVHRIKYSYTDMNACTDSAFITLSVSDLPAIQIKNLHPICNNMEAVVLDFCAPAGGRYSGKGIIGGKIYPHLAGTGKIEVRY